MEGINRIIYGADDTEKIVSIEVKNDEVIAYFNDGSFKTQPAKYFILSFRKIDDQFVKMTGHNYYKWVRVFEDYEQFKQTRKNYFIYRDDIWAIANPTEMHMLTRGSTLFKGLQVNEVSRLGFDIETDGLLKHKDSKVFTISNTFRQNNKEIKKTFRLDEYENCGQMINAWCQFVRELNPTMMVAHNGIGYDLPYLDHVAKLYGTEINIGRDGSAIEISSRSKNYRVDGSQTWEYNDIKIFGRHIVDTMFLSVKYDIGRNFPSWGLKPIIEHLGLVEEGRQFYDASQIGKNWDDLLEREKIVKYCEDDGDDCLNLYELMIPSYFYLCQSIPKPFQAMINGASGSWLNYLFIRSYLQDFSSIPKATEVKEFEGAISYGVPGVYSNCFKQDVASLYPSIMRQYKICNTTKDPNRYFSRVVEYFTLERLKNKKIAKDTGDKYYSDLEQSQKIVINSLYGFLGAKGLHFNSPDDAALITRYGREILGKAIEWSTNRGIGHWKYNGKGDGLDICLANCDTDSIMIYKQDQSFWTPQEREEFLVKMNEQFPELIVWEDDGYYDRVIVVKSKNYVLLPEHSDKIKFKGSSFKSSTKEKALNELLVNVCKNIVYKELPPNDVYMDYIKEILNITDISRWCKKKSITEKLLEANDTAKKKVLEAIKDIDYRVGDKVYLFNDIDGMVQKVAKGEPVFLKSGKPSMKENKILKLDKDFTGTYDMKHYFKRAYDTIKILEPVIDLKEIVNYGLNKNYKQITGQE